MRLTGREIVGLVMGIVPFFINLGITSERSFSNSIDGTTVHQTMTINLLALLGGLVAIGMALRQREAVQFEGAQYTPGELKLHGKLSLLLALLGAAQLIYFVLGWMGAL